VPKVGVRADLFHPWRIIVGETALEEFDSKIKSLLRSLILGSRQVGFHSSP